MVNGYKPATLDEALGLRRDTDAVPYAGGTDLMVRTAPASPTSLSAICRSFAKSARTNPLSASGRPSPSPRPWNPI